MILSRAAVAFKRTLEPLHVGHEQSVVAVLHVDGDFASGRPNSDVVGARSREQRGVSRVRRLDLHATTITLNKEELSDSKYQHGVARVRRAQAEAE